MTGDALAEEPVLLELPFARQTQYGNSLCWAACVVSAAVSSGNRTLTQNHLAHRFVPSCRVALSGRRLHGTRCDRSIAADQMAGVWRYAGFPNVERRRLPDRPGQVIARELANRRPVQAWIDRFHSIMVYGYRKASGGEENVLIMDPQPGFGDGWRKLGRASRWSALWVGLDYQGSDVSSTAADDLSGTRAGRSARAVNQLP